MNKATITKTLNKVNSQDKKYSLGFRRLHALPLRSRKMFNLACFSKGIDINEVHQEQKEFLESLNDAEFINWLAVNA